MGLEKIKHSEEQVEDIYQKINTSIPIFFKKIKPIVENYKVSSEVLSKELIKYLIITKLSTKMTSPSYVVDLAWHELILFTRFYERLCKENFNEFVHHTPSENENPEAFLHTLELYKEIFNNPPKEIWLPHLSFDINDTECGACHN